MALYQTQGDLLAFSHNVRVIAHSCNCLNVMGAGIAAQIKQKYPEAWKADCEATKRGENKLGKFSYARVLSSPDRFVFNLYTQQSVGRDRRHVSYDALDTALRAFKYQIEEWVDVNNFEPRDFKIGFPYKLSAKNAGGSWPVILAMLNDIFDNSELDATIFRNPLYDPVESDRTSLR